MTTPPPKYMAQVHRTLAHPGLNLTLSEGLPGFQSGEMAKSPPVIAESVTVWSTHRQYVKRFCREQGITSGRQLRKVRKAAQRLKKAQAVGNQPPVAEAA